MQSHLSGQRIEEADRPVGRRPLRPARADRSRRRSPLRRRRPPRPRWTPPGAGTAARSSAPAARRRPPRSQPPPAAPPSCAPVRGSTARPARSPSGACSDCCTTWATATGPIDGRFGPRTRSAVGWFQRKHGLAVNGVVGAATLSHLQRRVQGGEPQAEGPAATRPARQQPKTTPKAQRKPQTGAQPQPTPQSPAADGYAAAGDDRAAAERQHREPGRHAGSSRRLAVLAILGALDPAPSCCAAGVASGRRRAP